MYFNDQSVHIISYTYTTPISTKIFNNIIMLQDLKSERLKVPIYNKAGHGIPVTGDLNIINNTSLVRCVHQRAEISWV
jgi:recombinational DNA repair protein RecR